MMLRRACLLALVIALMSSSALAGVIPSGAKDVTGRAFDASALSKPVNMIFIWATWSGYCASEIPDINALVQEYKGRVGFAGVTLDAVRESGGALARDEDAISAAAQLMRGARFQSVVPNDTLYAAIRNNNVQTMPTIWFVDAGGSILYTVTGCLPYKDWCVVIDGLLK